MPQQTVLQTVLQPTRVNWNHPIITQAQRSEFWQRGLIKLPGLIPESVAAAVRATLSSLLERAGVCVDGQWTADLVRTNEEFLNIHSKLQKRLKDACRSGIEAFNTREVADAAQSLVEQALDLHLEKPQLLFTPPNADRWSVPNKVWHVDLPRTGDDRCPGVQMFSFIDEVAQGAGGTVVAAGSHRYLNNHGVIRSKQVKRSLRATHPWFKGLFHPHQPDTEKYLAGSTCDGEIELQVVELTGRPGDVYLMDMRLLHSLAPNASKKPRLMVTQRYYSHE